MTSKQETVKHILDAQLLELTRTNQHWLSFLQTAANNYKYSFTDQVLIYAQKPDATACADMAFWNQKMQRWINKNAKGIALVDTSGIHPRLHYVFDVSDTNSRTGSPISLWTAAAPNHEAIIAAMETSFGTILSGFNDLNEYGNINTLTDEELETAFRLAVQQSVQYMLLYRCGIDAPDLIYQSPLQPISFFNTEETVSVLGHAVSDLAEMGLREIEKAVRTQQRQQLSPNRTFATIQKNGYDEAGRLPTPNIETERRTEYESDLHEERRRFDPELDLLTPEVSAAGQIRDAAQDVSQGESQAAVQPDAEERYALAASAGDRRAGTRDGGSDGRTDGESRGLDGEDEIDRPDALGGADEQLQERSGGDRPAGDRVRINIDTW